MNLQRWIIVALWLVFAAYWAVAAVGVKRSAGGRRWGRESGLRLVAIVVIVSLLRSSWLRPYLVEIQRIASHSAALAWIGVALCLVGFGLAISARRHLGRNWGMPMALKEQPELVTSGPYARIRHPIYTGLILAMLGSAFGVDLAWALFLLPVGAYFIYSARREEANMLKLFPQQYAAYRERTGMLAPRLFPRH